jgi:hypothetical protein
MNNVLKRTTLIVRDTERQRIPIGEVVFVMQTDDVDVACRRLAAWP